MGKTIKLKVNLPPDEHIGTVTFKNDYECKVFGDKFVAGQTVEVGKSMLTPFGETYYKVFGTKVWVTCIEVTNINVKLSQRRTYRSIL